MKVIKKGRRIAITSTAKGTASQTSLEGKYMKPKTIL